MGTTRRATAGLAVIVGLAAEHGVTAERCLAGTGLSDEDLTDPEHEIDAGQELDAVANLLDACDEPGLGLIAGSRMHFTAYGVWAIGMMSCPTAREAAGFWLRHADHTFAMTEARMEIDQVEYRILLDAGGLPAKTRTFFLERDMAMAMTLHQEMMFTSVTPRRLHFTYPAPAHADHYRGFFGIDPVFSAARNLIALDAALLDRPLPMADHHIVRRSEKALARLAGNGRADAGRSFAVRVRAMLVRDPALGLDGVAARLAVSPRTVRRRLAAEGTGYRELLDDVRAGLAERLLGEGLPAQDIARRLGYSEPAAFIHAFRRWKGVPPGRYRQDGR
ncbi:AraC family transcriptional regulator [Actinomadura craniellae]|uniref:AraC family transcriptional regulator n=1 Tax=Actinomadura craniellae TaxID=2231787 RepID=A0A365HCH4_9ACTN|nr:AraC family transcriptional regulator [Actinomadura craniellae]RAY16805.1 AraC family transcriptional regulator [Actinomadura craniellae]